MNVNIIGTIGKVEDGILVLIDIEYNENIYECSYWYNQKISLLTTPDTLDGIIDIKTLEDYPKIKEYLLNTLEPYEVAISKTEELDVDYQSYLDYIKLKTT